MVRAYAGHREGRCVQKVAEPVGRSLGACPFAEASGVSVRCINIRYPDLLSMIAPSVHDETITARDPQRDGFARAVLAIGSANAERNIGHLPSSIDRRCNGHGKKRNNRSVYHSGAKHPYHAQSHGMTTIRSSSPWPG